MNKFYEVDVSKMSVKESYLINGYAELDLENIKEVSKYRNLFIVIENKKELERLKDMDYIFISTKKQYRDVYNHIQEKKLIVILDSLTRLDLNQYSGLIIRLNRNKYTVVYLNFKGKNNYGHQVDEDVYLDSLEIYCWINYKEKTVRIKEQYKDTFFSDRVLEYIRINGECKFQHYKTEKFDYGFKEEKVKIFAIMKKDNSIKNIIDKTLVNIPVILESKNNQWYDVKYKLVRRR